MKKRGLGRGLNELLGDPAVTSSSITSSLDLSDISIGPYQPRKSIDDDALRELADSIKVQGLIQPIVVREVNSNAEVKYEIIAGERRWRASKIAGLKTVPVVIKNVDDYLLRPLGEGFFRFNMQFDYDSEIKGDLEVKARGTESLMANEVRSQRLLSFLQVASNPALAPFAKFQYVI